MKKKLLISLGLLLISTVSIYAYCEEFSHYFSPWTPRTNNMIRAILDELT